MTKLLNVMIQLTPQLRKQIAGQPMHFSSERNFLERFGGNQNQFHQFRLSLGIKCLWLEFVTDCTQMTFVLRHWKETAPKWAILFTEGNDSVLDNYQGFVSKLKGHLGDPIQSSQIWKLKQRQGR